MGLEITKMNGDKFRISEYDIEPLNFIVSSLPNQADYEELEGSNRLIDNGTTYGQRIIEVPILIKAKDSHDIALLRDQLFSIITGLQPFWIRELRKITGKFELVGGKRYLVRLQNAFQIEQISNFGLTELIFETVELPFAESIGTTQDIDANGITSNDELWGFGMGLIDDDELSYTHEGRTFKIFNAGNEAIHPFEQDLKIIINNVNGSLNYLELKNITNGSRFRTTTAVTSGQEIVMDGPSVTRDGLSFLRETTKEVITLDPGWNEFEISGAASAKVMFDFRFYYK